MKNYKKMFFEAGYSKEDWDNAMRYKLGARDVAAKAGHKLYNAITNPITNPTINPTRSFDGFGKRHGNKVNPRKGICEVCGRARQLGDRQLSLHHIAHDSVIANDATIEVCQRCHDNIEGQGARYTTYVMEFGGVI